MSDGNRTILVVDDEPLLRQLVAAVLQGEGLEVVLAGSPQHARDALGCAPEIAVAVIDVDLKSTMDGYDLACELTALRPGLRTIFATGGLQPTVLPPDALFLEKPFTPARLLDCIEQALPHR